MPSDNEPASATIKGKLTVQDARHIVNSEGGELTPAILALNLLGIAAIAALTARAITVGNATVWHLALPMVAQYFALILAIPFLQVFVRHPDLNADAIRSLRLWILFGAIAVVAVAVRSGQTHAPWQQQLAADSHAAWRWIADAQMHWPVLVAFLAMIASMPGRVRNLFEHGPPFVGVSLGCGMRFAVLLLGCFLLPWALSDAGRMAWFLWWLILVSELLALWMHWDLQKRLRKFDGKAVPADREV